MIYLNLIASKIIENDEPPSKVESCRANIASALIRGNDKLFFRPLFKSQEIINCSDPSWGGGRNYILKRVFFVQSILADRYINRRELRLVSLESLSSVEYGIKKIFLFSFLTRYRVLNFRENRVKSVDFIHFFRNFLTKILPILIKFNKIFKKMFLTFCLRLKTEYIVGYFH